MKRTPLKRKTPLERKPRAAYAPMPPELGTGRFRSPLKPLRSPLKPFSAKKRKQMAADRARVASEGAAFHAAIRGERCVVCGKTAQEAREAGTRHQAHHGIKQEVLKRLGLRELLWTSENAVCCCEEPCHRQHTGRQRRIPYANLPPRVVAFAKRNGLLHELEREYPT